MNSLLIILGLMAAITFIRCIVDLTKGKSMRTVMTCIIYFIFIPLTYFLGSLSEELGENSLVGSIAFILGILSGIGSVLGPLMVLFMPTED